MAARPTEVGRSSSSVRAQTLPVAVSDQINVGLKLGDQELTFDKGVWSRVARRAGDEEPRPVVDTAEIERLRKLLDEQKSRADSLEQEKQLLLLKNRILTEMVAVTQLDNKKKDEELATERMRVEALKWKVTIDARDALKA